MQKSKRRKGAEEPMEVDEAPAESEANCGDNDPGNSENAEIDHISDDEEGGVRIGDIYIPPAPKPALTFDTTGPRLIITQIVNDNFKSYAGLQTLGPFHKSFTAIIGPNGSGKSNVIDSMLFVFGYRASKIRSKKISVLIHRSSKYPNLTSASVAVHFCQIIDGEGQEFTVVPNSEIIVTRTAFKDNSSYYTLNGRRVQFKEVAKMLRSHGIDLVHNRFLILQGEVEQIAMMKPRGATEHESGMLEYLEDIIGTSRYKEPIEKLSLKVEEYSEMRKEKLNRVRLVEQEKLKLEEPMRESVNLMNIVNTCTRTRNLLTQKYIFETDKIIQAKTRDIDMYKEKIANIDEKLKEINTVLKEKNVILSAGTEKYSKLKKDKEEVTEKLVVCKTKMVTIQADTTMSNKKRKNLEQLLQQEKGKLIDLELVPEKNRREIEDCEKLLEKHNVIKLKADEELKAALASIHTKTQDLQREGDRIKAELIKLTEIVDKATEHFKSAELELKIYLSTEETEAEKLELEKAAYEKVSAKFTEKQTMQKELSTSLSQDEKKLNEMQTRMRTIKTEEASISDEARTLKGQVVESKQAMSANRTRGRVLDTLMNEKKRGTFPGIFGRLGDLGGIPLKYDVAISTSCPALDNIVVDTVETAQACVEYLKQKNIGRATFIALNKQEHLRQYFGRNNFPEKVPRLFDLITVKDQRVLPAFYFALRDTLVANELEQATRIAYGSPRYRVVTLGGDVIELAGTMAGGGKSVIRGRMSSSVQQDTSQENDPQAIEASERRLEQLETRLSELRTEQSELEKTLSILEKSVGERKAALNILNIEIKSLTTQVPVMKNQIKDQEKRVASAKVDEAIKKRLEDAVETALEKLEKAKHDAGEVKKESDGVAAQINILTGGKIKDLEKVVNDLNNKITKVNSEIMKLNVAITTSVRSAKKSKLIIAKMEADLSETQKLLEELSTMKKQHTIESGELQKKLEELEEELNEGTSEYSELKTEISALKGKENKIQSERLEVNSTLNNVQNSLEESKAKMMRWNHDLSKLSLEEVPGVQNIPGLDSATPLETHAAEELESYTVEELRSRLKVQIERMGDNKPNIQAILDYRAAEELYVKRAGELDEITARRNEMRALYDQLRKKRQSDFLSGFNTITGKLKEMYQMITLGGDAELELVDSLDPFTEGITFSVRPPSKSWKNISNLSGGEKTLSSLALVFALHYYKPTPLYVMDEIDAALDFKNVSIVANYIKERTKNAQFIIISLRYNMFEVSNRLVGIYKTEDCTKSVTVENQAPEEISNEVPALI